MLGIKLSDEDNARLTWVCVLLPGVKRTTVARAALLLGLRQLERDPSRIKKVIK